MNDRIVNLELFSDLASRRVVGRDGSPANLSPVTVGDRLLCSLRSVERAETGEVSEVDLPVRSLKASIGRTMQPPERGTFRLRSSPALGGRVDLTPAAARYVTAVFVSDPDGNNALEAFVADNSSFAASVAEAAAIATGLYSVTVADDGTAIFRAVNPAKRIGVTYTNNTPDDPETDFQPSTVYGDPIPAGIVDNDSAPINFDEPPASFLEKVEPIIGKALALDAESPAPSCWLFRAVDGSQLDLAAGPGSRLDPVSFIRVRSFERYEGEWWVEVRLIQSPLAFSDSHERVLPPPPSVRRVRAGTPEDDTQPPVNELQTVYLPPDFRGTYFLRWNYRVTRVLGPDDGQDEIADALNAMFDDGEQRFAAENPEPNNAYVEFLGELAGAPQPLITVDVNTFSPGVLTFLLPLDRAEMFAALRAADFVDAPLEVEVEVELGDPETPEVPGRFVTLFSQTIRVVRENNFAELGTVQNIDWQTPPSARDYVPFTRDQIISGVLHYTSVFGDGEAREFLLAHNLGTEALHATIRENAAGGRVLVSGVDYLLTIPNAASLLVAIPPEKPVPAVGALAATISTAGPVSAFLAHTHTIAQVVGLLDALAVMQARLESLEDLLPTGQLARREERGEATAIEIPAMRELYPARLPEGFSFAALEDAASIDAEKLPRAFPLLPALHVAAVEDLPGALPPVAISAGKVYKRTSATPLLIPGGGGRHSSTLEQNGFVGSDGRFWYRLTRSGESNSFYPTDLERELFVLHINEAQWQPGESLSVVFNLELQLLKANTAAQMVVVIEAGTAPGQTTPAPTDPKNLERITWAAAPLLVQRVMLSPVRVRHHLGAALHRSTADALSGERLTYTAWSAAPAGSLPTGAGVVLRARLVQFDTENPVKGAAGLIYYSLSEATATIS